MRRSAHPVSAVAAARNASSPPGEPANKDALGRRYWWFWSSSTVSAFGDNLRAAALPLLATTLTRNATIISLIAVASYLPWLLFGPIGGVIGDRGERSATMGATNLARAALTFSFVVLVAIGDASIAAICVLTASLTVLQIIYSSAATGFLTQIVAKNRLALGNSRLESGRSLAGQFLGAPVGALLFSLAHWLPLVIDSVTFVIAFLLLPRLRVRATASPRPAKTGYLRSLGEGWTFTRGDRAISAIAILLAAVNLVTAGINAIMVLFVLEVLRAPDAVYGLLVAALALGAFIGTFTTPPSIRRLGAKRLIAGSVILRVACLTVVGLSWSPWAAAIALVVQGITMTSWNVVSTTTIQTRTPAPLVGRVGTLVKTVAISTAPLGALAAGQIVGLLGLRAPFLIGAGVVAVAGLLTLPLMFSDMGERIAA